MPIGKGTDKEMIEYGWTQGVLRLHYAFYDQRTGRYFDKIYDFDPKRIACFACKTNEWAWVTSAPSGVFWACSNCRVCQGPLSKQKFAELVEEKEITALEALEICQRTGQALPTDELRDLLITRRRRRQRKVPRKPPAKEVGAKKKTVPKTA